MALWRLHGDGRTIAPGAVVAPDERLTWPRTTGVGMQHVIAMFGATFLVPVLTHFPVPTTLFFSGVGTLLFLVLTRGRVPSYLGSSFAFIAPVGAAMTEGGIRWALGGIMVAGLLFALVGLVVQVAGHRWIDIVLPPVVTGAIVALIGLNLAPTAWTNVKSAPVTAVITLAAIVLIGVLFRGMIGRLSIFLGVIVGYVVAGVRGELDFTTVRKAAWFGLPHFQTPSFHLSVMGLFVPVVLVLIAENVGHVKAVASMTDRDLDDSIGRAFLGDGVSTVLAGLGGGSGTTTYAENIGVMAATKVYSTAAYAVAGLFAVLLSLFPKFGALIDTIPAGVLGGATTVLYGLIGVLGARIWVESHVDFKDQANLVTAAVALIIGIANFEWAIGDLSFNGIALGSVAAIVVYHVMRVIGTWRGTAGFGGLEESSPSSLPSADVTDHAPEVS